MVERRPWFANVAPALASTVVWLVAAFAVTGAVVTALMNCGAGVGFGVTGAMLWLSAWSAAELLHPSARVQFAPPPEVSSILLVVAFIALVAAFAGFHLGRRAIIGGATVLAVAVLGATALAFVPHYTPGIQTCHAGFMINDGYVVPFTSKSAR